MKRNQRSSHYSMRSIINSVYERANMQALVESLKPVAPQLQTLDSMLQAEKALDSLINKKRADLVEIYSRPPVQARRVLRVHLNLDPVGTVELRGYLFPWQAQSAPKATAFLKQVSVSNKSGEDADLIWRKSAHEQGDGKDGLLFKLGIPSKSCDVAIHLAFNPQRYSLDPFLQRVVGVQRGTRVEVAQLLWAYINKNRLLDPQSKEVVNDGPLSEAFKCERMSVGSINGKLRQLLNNLEPIQIALQAGVQRIIDVEVLVELEPQINAMPLLSHRIGELQKGKELNFQRLNSRIKKIDKKIVESIEKLERFKNKRESYLNFAEGPASFVESLVEEQNELLRIINEKDPLRKSDPRRLEYLLENEEELQRQVINYLQSQAK